MPVRKLLHEGIPSLYYDPTPTPSFPSQGYCFLCSLWRVGAVADLGNILDYTNIWEQGRP